MSTEVYERLRAVEMEAALADKRIESHEKICAERYQRIDMNINHTNKKLDRVINNVVWTARLAVVTCIGVLGYLLQASGLLGQ